MKTINIKSTCGKLAAITIAASAAISTFGTPTPENMPDYFVEWVQPSAGLYVDTGVIGKDGTKIELRAMCDADSFSGTKWPIILGSNKSNSNGRFNLAMFESYSGLKTRWELNPLTT